MERRSAIDMIARCMERQTGEALPIAQTFEQCERTGSDPKTYQPSDRGIDGATAAPDGDPVTPDVA